MKRKVFVIMAEDKVIKKSLILNTLIVLVLCFAITSCAALTPKQKAQLQQRTYNNKYEDVFQAARTVLEDEGHTFTKIDIDNRILVTGLIRPPIRYGVTGKIKWDVSFRPEGDRTTVLARIIYVYKDWNPSEVVRGSLSKKYSDFFEALEKELSR